MPSYCYSLREEKFWRHFRMGEAPEEFVLSNGEVAIRDRQAEIATQSVAVKGTETPVKRSWPLRCFASGVHPDDGPKLAKHLRDRGCPTEVKGGDPVYTSAAHRRKALKIRGLVDKNSFS